MGSIQKYCDFLTREMTQIVCSRTFLLSAVFCGNCFYSQICWEIIKQMFIFHSLKKKKKKGKTSALPLSSICLLPFLRSLLRFPPLKPQHVITVICHANEPCSKKRRSSYSSRLISKPSRQPLQREIMLYLVRLWRTSGRALLRMSFGKPLHLHDAESPRRGWWVLVLMNIG